LQEVPVSKLFELISGAAAYLSPIREAHKWPFYLHSEARPNGCSVLRIAIIDRYTNKTVLIIYIIDTLVMSDDDDDEFDTPILFQFHDGETLTCNNKYDYHTDLDHSHPIMHSGLVQSLLEDHEENEQLVIPLPAFISRDHFVLLYNHVVHHHEALQRVGFGKHSTWRFQDVLSDENYIEWMRDCIHPCIQMEALLGFDLRETIRNIWNDNRAINQVAKHFQIDICSECGISTEIAKLNPCCRTSWQNIVR
jgi:hypothetical protein